MSLKTLRDLIQDASLAVEQLFHNDGGISAMYHAVTAENVHLLVPVPPVDKDLAIEMVKAMFVDEDVERYVFMDEAWMLDSNWSGSKVDVEQVRREGVRNHPDRREIVMFSAENRSGQFLTAKRFILRPEVGRPKLTALKFDNMADMKSSGRLVGLLKGE